MNRFARSVAIATVALFAGLSAASAQIANVQQSTPKSFGSSSTSITTQCYPSAITYKPNCTPKKVTAEEECFCSEVPVKTSTGVIKMKVKCSELRIKKIAQVIVKANDCTTIKRLPRV